MPNAPFPMPNALIKKRGTSLLLLANPVCRSLKERRTLYKNIALIENKYQLLIKIILNKIERVNF
ncbi:MAG: hypothetical protein V7L30_27820 [Nostoc sp.]|uniref:hypothetical protein n=1 Tax=Nostoc sp. TaxID=1180 RepID=UPI002FF67C9E